VAHKFGIRQSQHAITGEESSVEPGRSWHFGGTRMLAEVIRLTGLRGLKLLTEAFTQEGAHPDLFWPMWDAERMEYHHRIVEVSRYIDDSFFVQKTM
jgi:hypothetical protein